VAIPCTVCAVIADVTFRLEAKGYSAPRKSAQLLTSCCTN